MVGSPDGGGRLAYVAIAMLALAAAAPCAEAGAWTETAGHGQLIVGATMTSGDRGFLANGRLAAAPPYRKTEIAAYAEYGLTDWLTAVVVPDFLAITAAGAGYDGPGQSGAGIRARIWQAAATVLSIQATVYQPGPRRRRNTAQLGYADAETDWRLLVGQSFTLGRWQGFTDMELSWRTRAGAPADEVHLDMTLGIRPLPRLTAMVQAFTVVTAGPARPPFLPGRWTKLQASLVYDLTPDWSVQLGALTTVLGANALREHGFVAAVWHRF
jgi:hypothetical protein